MNSERTKAISAIKDQTQVDGVPVGSIIGCLISDIEMPQMDGLALCKNIKENLGIKDLPVIMFSSLINEQIARKCEDVGSDAYITKPQFRELVQLLDEFALKKEPVTV